MEVVLLLLVTSLLVQASSVYGINLDTVQCTQVALVSETPVYFKSPGSFPVDYLHDYDGCWVVRSEVPNLEPRIDVMFSAIEAIDALRCPVADFVEVRDGDNHNASLLLQFCGWGHPDSPFVASNNSLYVYFHTDDSISYGGFEMKAYVNASSTGPATPSSGPDPRSITFNDDQQSLGSFKDKINQNLPINDPFKETGMKVAIGLSVLIGVIIIGVITYYLTKYYFRRQKAPWDPLEGVIFSKRIYLGSFSRLIEHNTPDSETPGPSGILPEPSGDRRPGALTPLDAPHPPPAPVYVEDDRLHPGLVFANYQMQEPLPGIGEIQPPAPEPAILELSPANLPTEPLTARTLITTGVVQTPESEDTGMTEVYGDTAQTPIPSPRPIFPKRAAMPSTSKHPKPSGLSDAQVRWSHIFAHTEPGKRKKEEDKFPTYASPYGVDQRIKKFKKQFFRNSSPTK